MPTFEAGQVVRVPFPYADRNTRRRRPALVISDGAIGEGGRFLWVAMITSAANPRRTEDCDLGESFARVGLPTPSVVRPTKIATIEASEAQPVGRIDDLLLDRVRQAVRSLMG